MKKYLEKHELNLVKSKFRNIVIDAWNKGEHVPNGIILVSDTTPTEKEIQMTEELNKIYKWE